MKIPHRPSEFYDVRFFLRRVKIVIPPWFMDEGGCLMGNMKMVQSEASVQWTESSCPRKHVTSVVRDRYLSKLVRSRSAGPACVVRCRDGMS